MSKLLVQLALLQTKAVVNAYTWSTLPLYTALQRPWRRLQQSKAMDVNVTIDKQGRVVYSRPSQFHANPAYQYGTFAETLPRLDRAREVVGIRDVLEERLATDDQGQPIRMDGRELKKIRLAKQFRWLTVGQVLDRVDGIARGLRHMGVGKGDKVLVYAENSPEWFFTGLALARLNAVAVTLFSTLGDDGVVYGVNQSDAKMMITSQYLLPKVLALGPQFSQLDRIVYFPNPREPVPESVATNDQFEITSLTAVEDQGAALPKCHFELPRPDDLAVIMYTSGTTGNPKGVMITHGQMFTSVKNMLRMDEEYGEIGHGSDHTGYLPMAHMFGYVVNMAVFATSGRIGFCSPFTLLDSSPSHVPGQVGDIRLIRPAYFVAVPLVLERILKEIYRKLKQRSPLAAPVFTYLMDYKIRWTKRGFDTPIINRLICKKINDQFGGRLKMIGVSSAPLHERTQAMVEAALNVKINLAYGSTENCGPANALHINDLTLGSCGVPYHSFRYYLKDWPEGGYHSSDRPNPRGEVVLGGDSIASGYYKMPDETTATFTEDSDGTRWYHTGDIGEVVPNMTLRIIDRKKDLTKLANGEFVSLGKIEAGLRSSELVENICVCTDPYCNHVVALISPNLRALQHLARTGHKHDGVEPTLEQLCDDPVVVAKVLDSLHRTGLRIGLNRKELPVHITLVPEEWTPANNLLTAAFKLKRRAVYETYRDKIAAMFGQPSDDDAKPVDPSVVPSTPVTSGGSGTSHHNKGDFQAIG